MACSGELLSCGDSESILNGRIEAADSSDKERAESAQYVTPITPCSKKLKLAKWRRRSTTRRGAGYPRCQDGLHSTPFHGLSYSVRTGSCKYAVALRTCRKADARKAVGPQRYEWCQNVGNFWYRVRRMSSFIFKTRERNLSPRYSKDYVRCLRREFQDGLDERFPAG